MSFVKKTNSNQNFFSSSKNSNQQKNQKNEKQEEKFNSNTDDKIDLSKGIKNKQLKEKEFGRGLENDLNLIESHEIKILTGVDYLKQMLELTQASIRISSTSFEEIKILIFDLEELIDLYRDLTYQSSPLPEFPFLVLPNITVINERETLKTHKILENLLKSTQAQIKKLQNKKEKIYTILEGSINTKDYNKVPTESAKSLVRVLEKYNEESINTQTNFKDQLFLDLINKD